MSRGKARALSAGLFVIAVGFAVVACVYLTTSAANLPRFFPGHLAYRAFQAKRVADQNQTDGVLPGELTQPAQIVAAVGTL